MMSWVNLRFLAFPVFQTIALVSLWTDVTIAMAGGILYLAIVVVADGMFGKNDRTADCQKDVLDWLVYLAPALQTAILASLAFHADELVKLPLLPLALVITNITILNTVVGIVFAHELMHKRRGFDFFLAQYCLSFSLHPNSAIDHVYHHHRNVGYRSDNATARHGEWFWMFLLRSLFGVQRNALNFEAKRLEAANKRVFSFSNRAVLGYVVLVLFSVSVFVIGGVAGMVLFVICGLIGYICIESGNYLGHYGLTREKNAPIRPHHSWNNFNVLSTSFLLNVSRHSDHHLHSSRKFWKLSRCQEDAPTYPFGFATMTVVALFPPLFIWVVKPELRRWREDLATSEELLLQEPKNTNANFELPIG